MTQAALDQTNVRSAPVTLRGSRYVEIGVVIASLALSALILRNPGLAAFDTLVMGTATASLVTWIVVQDLGTFTIPDGAVISIAGLAFVDRWLHGDAWIAMGLDAFLIGGILFAVREIHFRRTGYDGLGLGDVKLAAAGGLLIGATPCAWALFIASLLALCFVGARRINVRLDDLRTAASATEKVAFGAALAPAIWAVWLMQHLDVLPFFASP